MDQGRLEELKRLLNERCGGAKQNRSEELAVENSETENSETENSETSNFKAQNSEVSNFESLHPESSNSEFPSSEISNYQTQNSKVPNSAIDALNLEAEADQNSACVNNTEPQNFISDGSGALPQNSKARDYDKEPITIKDNSIEMIKFYSPFLYFLNFIDFETRQDSPRSVKRWLGLPSKFGTCYIKFKNSVIEYYSEKKRATLYSINLSEIIAIKRTFGPSTFKMTKKGKISTFFVAFVWIILLSLVVTFKNKISYGILIVPISLFLAFAPLIIFRFKKNLGFDIGNDSFIFMSNGNYIEASILTSKEYRELKTYFLLKTGKNLDKIRSQIFV